MDAFGWSADDIVDSPEYTASNVPQALCDNEFDAFVHTIGNPNAVVKEAINTCGAVLVPVIGPAVDKLVEARPAVMDVVQEGPDKAVHVGFVQSRFA